MSSGMVARVRGALRGNRPFDADALLRRIEAVRRFVDAVEGHLPEDRLAAARKVTARADERLALSREHTVVALAGSTGSGKSSLFNALARLSLSPVGVRRPTTGAAHACVWGPLDGATKLLDWVGVLPRRRFVRESALDADDEAPLHGLVLLDLPDFDSVERAHRTEADRLLGLVDLVIWVVDPQKYADRVVHESYLSQFHQYRDVTVVVLNQADRLAPADVPRVVDDLRGLLTLDGLADVPVFATSAVQPSALVPLRGLLERTVAERQAVLLRLSGDVDVVADELTEMVSAPVSGDVIDDATVAGLVNSFAGLAGVPAVVSATGRAYRHRAAGATGWPLVRGLRRLRPDPLRRLHLPTGAPASPDGSAAISGATSGDRPAGSTAQTSTGQTSTGQTSTGQTSPARTSKAQTSAPLSAMATADGVPVPLTSMPEPDAAQRSAVGLAVRAVTDRAAAPLPRVWASGVADAARSRLADVPDALDRAVARTDLGVAKKPLWWRVVGAVQWLATLTALLGLLWLVGGYALRALGLPRLEYPRVGEAPVPTLMLLGGLLGGALVALAVRPIVAWGARRARRRVERRLRDAVATVAQELVLTPVREVLQSYTRAREAMAAERSDRA